MITRNDVAKRAGVSVGTVSNVMNNKSFVKPEHVEKVRKAIEELNYIPDFNAKSMARRRNNHIGIALYEMTNPYHAEIIQGIEEYAAQHNFMTTIFVLNNTSHQKYHAICERRLDGLVNFMTNDLPRAFTAELKRQQIVLVNFSPEDSFMIVNDYTPPMREFMRLLQEGGHRKVAYLWTGDEMRFRSDKRGKTFLEEREKYGFDSDESLILFNEDMTLTSEQIGYRLCKRLLQRHPDVTAVFCTNDLAALGALRCLSEAGRRCPEDVSVIGCDDIALGEYFNPPISTISFDKRAHGADIAQMIIEKVADPESHPYHTVVVPMHVKLRQSIAPAKN